MTILKDSSKPSTPTKVKCINKAWYKKYIPFDTPTAKTASPIPYGVTDGILE